VTALIEDSIAQRSPLMKAIHFDDLLRAFPDATSRRGVLGGLVALSLAAVGFPGAVDAKKKHKKKHKKKVTFNDFGCVNVGGFCKNSDQCCSGICQGKKDKKTCQAHDSDICTGNVDTCAGGLSTCATATGEGGSCFRTTGNAGYCAIPGAGGCVACAKDADCVSFCGAQAACIICESQCAATGGTGCIGPSSDRCTFPGSGTCTFGNCIDTCNGNPQCTCYTTTEADIRCGDNSILSQCGECSEDAHSASYGPYAFCAIELSGACGGCEDEQGFCRTPCPS
jgi:hypothetical protein